MIYTIDIKITNKCNLSCSYCSDKENRSNETLSDVDGVENFIDSCVNMSGSQLKKIILWGGEPTSEPEITNRLLRFCSSRNLETTIVTNGVSIDSILETAKECNTTIQVSYDGIGSNHKRGSTDKVLETFTKLDDYGVNYNVKSTIPPYDFFKLSENYFNFKYLQTKHKGNFSFKPTIDYINKIVPEHLPELLEILDRQLDIIIKDRETDKNTIGFSWLTERVKYNCGAGRGMIGIDTDGRIYPCHVGFYIKEKDQIQMGDIYDLGKVLESIRLFNSFAGSLTNQKCIECTGCNKICPAARFSSSNELTMKDKWCDVANYTELCEIQNFIANKTRPYWVSRS
jgi:radical SAM protein with 4Fe4S-binding SPASM domain